MTSKTTFTVHAILKGNASGYSLGLFTEKEIAALEIVDQKGKPVLVCAVTGKGRPLERTLSPLGRRCPELLTLQGGA